MVAYTQQLKECRRVRREKGKFIRQFGLGKGMPSNKQRKVKKIQVLP
jgi:hypothetical protein